jgi:hypothetical protein
MSLLLCLWLLLISRRIQDLLAIKSCAEFNKNRTINVESMDRGSFTSLSKVWVLLPHFTAKFTFPDFHLWKNVFHSFPTFLRSLLVSEIQCVMDEQTDRRTPRIIYVAVLRHNETGNNLLEHKPTVLLREKSGLVLCSVVLIHCVSCALWSYGLLLRLIIVAPDTVVSAVWSAMFPWGTVRCSEQKRLLSNS